MSYSDDYESIPDYPNNDGGAMGASAHESQHTGYSPYNSDERLSTRYFEEKDETAFYEPIIALESKPLDSYYWSNKFQQSMADVRAMASQTVNHKERSRVWSTLAFLADTIENTFHALGKLKVELTSFCKQDFIEAATTYGKIIISESQLPYDQKTIKPTSGRGVAGGEKYIIHSIMFKFAVDHACLFRGDDHAASRVAGHDLLGLNSLLSCGVSDLHFPLTCLLDYRGFRLVCLSLLPIDQSTLAYGSDDAGKSVQFDPIIHCKLLLCAQKLNLRDHHIVEAGTKEIRRTAIAMDVEGHRSKLDGKIYVVDCSRAMPPSALCKDNRYSGTCKHLTTLLRPEFVASNPVPLVNDVFSICLYSQSLQRELKSYSCTSNSCNLEFIDVLKKSHVMEVAKLPPPDFSPAISASFEPNSTPIPTSSSNSNNPISVGTISAYELEAYQEVQTDATPKRYAPSISQTEQFLPSSYPTHFADSKLYFESHPVDTNRQVPDEDAQDALDEFLASSKAEYEQDVKDATQRLLNITIPKFAAQIAEDIDSMTDTEQSIFTYDWFFVVLHWHGINIRHLGTIRNHIPPDKKLLRSLLLNMMVSRVLKNLANHQLRMEMKKERYAGEHPYLQKIVDFMNTVFGTSTQSLKYWNIEIRAALDYQFPDALTEEEKNMDLRVLVLDNPIIEPSKANKIHKRAQSNKEMRMKKSELTQLSEAPSPSPPTTSINSANSPTNRLDVPKFYEEPDIVLPVEPICFLFFTFCKNIGLSLKEDHMESFASDLDLFKVDCPIHVLDLEGLPVKVKTLQIVAHGRGLTWKVRAEAAASVAKSRLFAAGLWRLALNDYRSSLLAAPRDQRTLRNVAEIYWTIRCANLASVFAKLALDTDPNDPVSNYKYATLILFRTNNPTIARRYFEAAIRAKPTTPGALIAYAEFFTKMKEYPAARVLLERCTVEFPTSADGLHKAAHFYQYISKDYDLAEQFYLRALELDSDDMPLLLHFHKFLLDVRNDEERARTYELRIKKVEQQSTIGSRGRKMWKESET